MGLIICRKIAEGFTIGDDIEVFVLGVDGHSVDIQINAPKHKKILRLDSFYKNEMKKKDLSRKNVNTNRYTR